MAFSSPYRLDCFTFCLQIFRNIHYLYYVRPLNLSQAPSSFSPLYIKPTYVSFPIYTLLVYYCFCISSPLQLIIPKVRRNTGTPNALVTVILFLVFSSDFIIVLKSRCCHSLVLSSFVDVTNRHFPQYRVTCRFFPPHL